MEEVGQNEGFCFVLLTHLCRLLWGPFPFLFKTAVAPEYFINSGFHHNLHLHFLQQSKIIKSEHSWGYENQNNRTYLYLDSVQWGYKGEGSAAEVGFMVAMEDGLMMVGMREASASRFLSFLPKKTVLSKGNEPL